MTSSVPVAQGAFVDEAFAVAAGTVASISFRQRHIPKPLLARVSNVFRAIIWGAIPLGALLGGILAQSVSLRAPFVVCGLAQLLIVGILARPLLERTRTVDVPSGDLVDVRTDELRPPPVPAAGTAGTGAGARGVQPRLMSKPS
jgi:MFS family permease